MALPIDRRPARVDVPVRLVNAVLGLWLFISAFAWTHSAPQMANTWILGMLAVIFSLVAIPVPPVRFVNSLLAVWLFVSAFALPHLSAVTVWNNAIVAIAIFIVSLVPSSAREDVPGSFGRATPPRPA